MGQQRQKARAATWNVVDPLVVALPAAALTLVVWALIDKPMDPAYAEYVFGGAKPGRGQQA